MHAGKKSKSSSFPGHCVIIYLHMQKSQTANMLMQAVTKLDGSFQNNAGMDSHAGFHSTSWYPALPTPRIHKSQAIFKMRLRTRYLGWEAQKNHSSRLSSVARKTKISLKNGIKASILIQSSEGLGFMKNIEHCTVVLKPQEMQHRE